jgi:large subunit ribosomal protein L9
VKAVAAEGVELDKKSVALDAPIKELGIYDLDVKLCADVVAKIKVWVVKK